MDDGTNGINRRTILKAGAWAVPVVALAVAAPAAAATNTGGELSWKSTTFGNSGSNFYKPGVEPLFSGGTTNITSATVVFVFAPTGSIDQVFGLSNGGSSGWVLTPYTSGDNVVVTWAGTLAPGNPLPPVALDMHFLSTPSSFTANVSSPQASSPTPVVVNAE